MEGEVTEGQPVVAVAKSEVIPRVQEMNVDFHVLMDVDAAAVDVISFEFENVSAEGLDLLASLKPVRPSPAILRTSQDRVLEKSFLHGAGVPTAPWASVESVDELRQAVERIGYPAVLKTTRLGYDGKGQAVIHTAADARRAWSTLGKAPLLYEEWVPFDCEASIIGARSVSGQLAVYPLCGNVHGGGILRLTCAPFGPPRWQRLAARYLTRVLAHFRYTGILALEFFVRRGRLIANEMAPRVHNSGHWTIEGAVTSQFENHLRAILDLPLGATRALGHSAMINLIGQMPPRAALLALEGVHLHDYGKRPRAGRKVGHCTVVEPTAARRDARARRLLKDLAVGVRIP